MSRLCYSCIPTAIVDDDKAKACQREFCAARSDIERAHKVTQGTRPPQANPGERPKHYYDEGGGA